MATTGLSAVTCRFAGPVGGGTCTVTPVDLTSNFTVSGATGTARLASSVFPKGAAGTPVEGRFGYLYRLDLTDTAGSADVTRLVIPGVASIDPQDYDGDAILDDLFVASLDGPGTGTPYAANWTGSALELLFSGAVHSGAVIGNGTSSVLIGFASWNAPGTLDATVEATPGASSSGIQAYVPLGHAFSVNGGPFVLETAVNLPAGTFALSSLSDAKRVAAGDEMVMKLGATAANVYGQPFILALDPLPLGGAPQASPGLLDAYVGPGYLGLNYVLHAPPVQLLPSTSVFRGVTVNGYWVTLSMPPGISASLMVQGVLLAPPGSAELVWLTCAHRFDAL